MNLRSCLFFIVFITLCVTSCKKDDQHELLTQEDRVEAALKTLSTEEEINFFDLDYVTSNHPDISPLVSTRDDRTDLIDSVYQHILFEHEALSIVPAMVAQYGYPVWNESDLLEESDGKGVPALLTPFVFFDESRISAYLMGIPLGNGQWHFMMVDRPTLNILLDEPDAGQDPNLRFHIAAYTRFDELLFNTKNQDFNDWLVEQGDLQVGQEWEIVSPRGETYTFRYCARWHQTLQGGDTRNCAQWVTITVNTCGSLGNHGGATSNFGSGPIGGIIPPGVIPINTTGSGGTTPNTTPLDNPSVLMDACTQFNDATGFEGSPQDLEALNDLGVSVDYLAANCGAIQIIFNSELFESSEILAMVQADNTDHPGLLAQIANRVFDDGVNADMIVDYVRLIDDTDLAFKGFELLWTFIDDHLEDVLENDEIDFLLKNGQTVGNKLKTAYFAFSQTQRDWLNNSDHQLHKEQVVKNLIPNVDDDDGKEFITDHVNLLMSDDDYKEFVESTVGWSSAMWAIAKELIGDKAVDLAFQLIPGFGQADQVKEAFKAAKNGDWVEFFVESSKVILKETPWGKWIKALNITQELTSYYKKVEKIWDKIGDLGEVAIERLWEIAKKSPLKINPTYLKYVADLETPHLGHVDIPNPMPVGYYRYNVFRGAFKAPELSTADFDNLQVHHALPQWALVRYQHLGITPNQMHSLENLRGIPNDLLDHTTITNYWEAFYNSNPNATLQEVLDYVKFIDDEFGHLFVPPVR